MGKKIINRVQVKISKKNHSSCEKKQQLNSLIKVLRPKVYITDSSSFKSLVQQLTGNGSSSEASQCLPSPPYSSSSSSTQIVDKVPAVIDVEDDHGGNPESSMETSFDASVDEPFLVCGNHCLALTEDYQINQGYNCDPLPFEDTNLTENHLLMNIVGQQELESSLVYRDFESLLLDHVVDEQILYPSLNVYSQIQQEVSIYDYELSGLI